MALAILVVLFLNLKAAHSEERMWFQGMASFYGVGDGFAGKRTACGMRFVTSAMTAASPDLPCGSIIQVCNLANQKCAMLTIEDRGPVRRLHRVLDVSPAAAKRLGFMASGVAKVDVQVLYRPH